MLNNWDEKVVAKLEKDWNALDQPGVDDTFELAASLGDSFLDIGCGYGRFYEYLIEKDLCHLTTQSHHYIGYDSSEVMIEKAQAKYHKSPERFFLRDITKPFVHGAEVVLCNEVLIHLTPSEQSKVLGNIGELSSAIVKAIILTIQISEKPLVAEKVKLKGQIFLNVVQSLKVFREQIVKHIPDINIFRIREYHLKKDVSKAVILLGRK